MGQPSGLGTRSLLQPVCNRQGVAPLPLRGFSENSRKGEKYFEQVSDLCALAPLREIFSAEEKVFP